MADVRYTMLATNTQQTKDSTSKHSTNLPPTNPTNPPLTIPTTKIFNKLTLKKPTPH
jgi:hypothetical protein